ncbi:carboxypeptidase regulatory-like domain-containing protein [Candidatus Sumerlaeota bacterium]|nr:carboxypeptidase regulatory-like domain-containing protein [Candidatus Sumerlaeota bacterium]
MTRTFFVLALVTALWAGATLARADYVEKTYYVEFAYDSYDDLWGTGLSSDWDDTRDSPWFLPGVQPFLGLAWVKVQLNLMMSGLARHIQTDIAGRLHVWYDPAEVYSLPDRAHTFPLYFAFEPENKGGNELQDYLGMEVGFTFGARRTSWSDVRHLDDMYSGDWSPSLFKKRFNIFDLGINLECDGTPSLEDYSVTGDDEMTYASAPIPIDLGSRIVNISLGVKHHLIDSMKGTGVSGHVEVPNGVPLFKDGVFYVYDDYQTREDSITLGVPAGYTGETLPIVVDELRYQSRISKQTGFTVSLLCFSKTIDFGEISADNIVSRYKEPFLSFSIPVSEPPPLPDLKPTLRNRYGGDSHFPDPHAYQNESARYFIYPTNVGDAPLVLAFDSNYGGVRPCHKVFVDGVFKCDLLLPEQTIPVGGVGNCTWFDHTFTEMGYHTVRVEARNDLEEMNYINNTVEFTVRVYPPRGTIYGTVTDLGVSPQPDRIYDLSFDGQLHEKEYLVTTASLAANPVQPAPAAYYSLMAPPDVYDVRLTPPAGLGIVPERREIWHANYTDDVSFELGHYGRLRGLVRRDDNDAPIEDAVVSIGTSETLTDDTGRFSLRNLPWGNYLVTVSKPAEDGKSMEYEFTEDNRDTWETKVKIPAEGGTVVVPEFRLVPDKTGPTDEMAQLDLVTTPTGTNTLPFLLYATDNGYPPTTVDFQVDGHPEYPAIAYPYAAEMDVDIATWTLPSGTPTLIVTFYDCWDNPSHGVAVVLHRDVDPPDVSGRLVSINADALGTNQRLVHVDLSAPLPETPEWMEVRNEDTTDWSEPLDYQQGFYWNVSSVPISGTKTVYVRYGDRAGNWSAELSDSIYLDTSGAVRIDGGAAYTNNHDVSVGFTIDPLVNPHCSSFHALGEFSTTTLWCQAWVANSTFLNGIAVSLMREVPPYADGAFPVEVYLTASRDAFNPSVPSSYLVKHTFSITDINGPNGNWTDVPPSAEEEDPGRLNGVKYEYFKVAPPLSLTLGQTYHLIVRASQINPNSKTNLGSQMNYGTGLFPDQIRIYDGAVWRPMSEVIGVDDWMSCRFYGRPLQASNDGTNWTDIPTEGSPMPWTLASGDGLKTVFIRYTNVESHVVQYFDQIALDTVAPTGTASIVETQKVDLGTHYASDITFAFSATDGGTYPSGVKCVRALLYDIMGWMDMPCDWRARVRVEEDGVTVFQVKFVDNAGNESTTAYIPFEHHVRGPDASVWIDDGSMYTTSRTVSVNLPTTTTVASMYLTCSDETQWDWIPYTTSLTHELPDKDGPYYFEVWFKDAWDNVGRSGRASVVLDRGAPDLSLFSIDGGEEATTKSVATLFSRCRDNASGVSQYRMAESLEALATAPWKDYFCQTTATLAAPTPAPGWGAWAADPEPAVATVAFQVRDRAGHVSLPLIDTIEYEAPTATPTPSPTPTPTPLPPLEVTEISRAGYLLMDHLKAGRRLYGDRTYQYVNPIPTDVYYQPYIRTLNADKDAVDDPFLTFQVNRPAKVYVALSKSVTTPPAWMSGWTLEPIELATTDPGSAGRTLFSRVFDAGQVVLGPNRDSTMPTGCSMYTVVIAPYTAPNRAEEWALFD